MYEDGYSDVCTVFVALCWRHNCPIVGLVRLVKEGSR